VTAALVAAPDPRLVGDAAPEVEIDRSRRIVCAHRSGSRRDLRRQNARAVTTARERLRVVGLVRVVPTDERRAADERRIARFLAVRGEHARGGDGVHIRSVAPAPRPLLTPIALYAMPFGIGACSHTTIGKNAGSDGGPAGHVL